MADEIQKWLDGQLSLGAAANWERDEIRIISEIGYTLAQQGRLQESVVLFEGLKAIAPATAYFQAALGALYLRLSNYHKAIEHLDAALKIEPSDIVSLTNLGEAHLRNGNTGEARQKFEQAVQLAERLPSKQVDLNDEITLTVKRARALLKTHKAKS